MKAVVLTLATVLSPGTAMQLQLPLGALTGTSLAASAGVAWANAAEPWMQPWVRLEHLNQYGYALLPLALAFLAAQQDQDSAQPLLKLEVKGVQSFQAEDAESRFSAQVCHPVSNECLSGCELSEEWSEYYGEEIWLCTT